MNRRCPRFTPALAHHSPKAPVGSTSCRINILRWHSVGRFVAANIRQAGTLTDIYFTKDKYDLLVIPGGAKGAETISGSKHVQALVREYLNHEKYVGMICAGQQQFRGVKW